MLLLEKFGWQICQPVAIALLVGSSVNAGWASDAKTLKPCTRQSTWQEREDSHSSEPSGTSPAKKLRTSAAVGFCPALFAQDFFSDQKAIWTSPFHLHTQDKKWLLPLGVGTLGLVASDQDIMRHFGNTPMAHSSSFSNYGITTKVQEIHYSVALTYHSGVRWSQHKEIKMGRHQRGYIFESSAAYHVRFYQFEIEDGIEVRKQRCHRLCTKDAKYTSTTCKAVRQLAEDFLRSVNSQVKGSIKADVRVVDFWKDVYLPFIRENKRHSTTHQYESLWNGKLKVHFGMRTLSEYEPSDAYKYLLSLKNALTRNSLAHVRSLASGIFEHAVKLGVIKANPWRAFRFTESKAPEPTVAYTLGESLAILAVLKDSPKKDAGLIFALSAFLGLRPSESAGLRWENMADDCIFVRGSVVYGRPDKTKTPQSVRQLPLISPVKELMATWRTQCMNPVEGWLFPNPSGGPRHMDAYAKHYLLTAVRGAGLSWMGLYAARRACATNLVALTGDVSAAYQVLGNSLAVVMSKYIKPSQSAGLMGLKMLEAAAKNGGDK
jgi:integrase